MMKSVRPKSAGQKAIAAALCVAIAGSALSAVGGQLFADAATPTYRNDAVKVSDAFGRTVDGGLGSADIGGRYTSWSSEAGQLAVRDGHQVVSLGPGQAALAYLPQTPIADVRVMSTLSLRALPSGGGLYDSVALRHQVNGEEYQFTTSVGANGVGQLAILRVSRNRPALELKHQSLPFKIAAGQRVVVEASVTGNKDVSLKGRVWLAGGQAPSWQVEATDTEGQAIKKAGSVGYGAYLSRRSTPIIFTHDDLKAWSLVKVVPVSTTTTSTTTAPPTTTKPKPTTTTTAPTTTTTAKQSGPATGNALGLDASGRTVPDSAYPVPANAVFMSPNGSDSANGSSTAPVKTLNRAIQAVPIGGTIVARGGTYRDWYSDGQGNAKIVTKTFTLQAYPHEQVWFDGTDVVPSNVWQRDSAGRWSIEWSTPNFCNGGYYQYRYNDQPRSNKGPCAHWDMANNNTTNPAAADPQMAFIDGKQLREVASIDGVKADTFFYAQDLAKKTGRLYIGTDPNGHTMALAKRPIALILGGSGYELKGIGFRRYATVEYEGISSAVYVGAKNTVVENVAIVENAGGGLSLQPQGGVVRHSVFARNGATGMGSNGHSTDGGYDGLVLENSLFSGNNAEQFGVNCSVSCGQAAIKIAHMNGFTVKNNVFENTPGAAGFWCDENCKQGVMVNNWSRNNRIGIFYEVSSSAIIASNLLTDNTYAGIQMAAASTKVYNNTIVGNGAIGIWAYDDSRPAGGDSGPDSRDVDIKNNVVSGNNKLTVKLSGGEGGAPNTTPRQFVTGLDYNSYFRAGGSQSILMNWSVGDLYLRSLSAVTSATGFETHGQDVSAGTDPFFVDQARGDYRVRSSSAAAKSATSLPGDVAKALGASTDAGRDRGAISWASN